MSQFLHSIMLILGIIARKCALALVILFITKNTSISVTILTGNLFWSFVRQMLNKSVWARASGKRMLVMLLLWIIPKNQNFNRFSRVSRLRSDKKVVSNQFIIGCTESQSKNRWTTVSIGIGPWFFNVQKEHPGALPGMKLESLWLVPRELLKNLKLNSRRSIGRKLLLQKPSRHFFVSMSTSRTPQLRSKVLTIFKS